MSDHNPSSADPLGYIVDEFLEALRQGQRPSVEEFARRYPEHAAAIRDMLPALLLMEKAKSDDAASKHRPAAVSSAAGSLQQLGDYQILREVGRGGMGVVYEAQQLSLGRHVALKVLTSYALLDPRHLGRFEREAKAAAKLHHTNIVPVFGVGEQNGVHYYVMQFIQGLGLDQVLVELRRLQQPGAKLPLTRDVEPGQPTNRTRDVSAVEVARSLLTGQFRPPAPVSPITTGEGEPAVVVGQVSNLPGLGRLETCPTTPAQASDSSATIHLPGQTEGAALTGSGRQFWQSIARIGVQVADALAHAAHQGVLHRDIKPSNLLLDEQGNVWVTDFGLAKADSDADNLTHTGDIVGTLRYMAPERFDGQGDLRSDVYSLGLTLYELLSLRPAFDEADRNKLVKRVMHDEPVRPRKLNPAVPPDLETVVLKAIAREPAHHYQTPAELAADLKRFVEDRPIRARRVSEAEKFRRWCRRNPLPASLLAGIVLVFLAGFAGVLWQWRQQKAAHAEDLVHRLLDADIAQVPGIVSEIELYRQWADPLLREKNARASADSREKLHTSLALLPVDAGQVDYLYGRLLDAAPKAVPVLRDFLAPHKDALRDKLWAVAEAPERGKESQRLHAAAALAKYDPESERWTKVRQAVANDLVTVSAAYLALWLDALRPVRAQLLPPLSASYRDAHRREVERALTTDILADYAADQPNVLADLLMEADDKQFARIYPKFQEQGEQGVPVLIGEIDKKLPAELPSSDDKREPLAKRQANAAVALVRMKQAEKTWPVGSLKPNDLGLFDTHGNVYTWCLERYQNDPQSQGEHGKEDKKDFLSINEQDGRVLRGGSFYTNASDVRCAYRFRLVPTVRNYALGFRPARTFKP